MNRQECQYAQLDRGYGVIREKLRVGWWLVRWEASTDSRKSCQLAQRRNGLMGCDSRVPFIDFIAG